MKKLLLLPIIGGLFIAVSSCNKNNGCPNDSEKATVLNYTDSDTCGILFQLEDGTKLEPTNKTEFPNINYETGQLIWLDYKAAAGASTCGIGDIVEIKCISEREF